MSGAHVEGTPCWSWVRDNTEPSCEDNFYTTRVRLNLVSFIPQKVYGVVVNRHFSKWLPKCSELAAFSHLTRIAVACTESSSNLLTQLFWQPTSPPLLISVLHLIQTMISFRDKFLILLGVIILLITRCEKRLSVFGWSLTHWTILLVYSYIGTFALFYQHGWVGYGRFGFPLSSGPLFVVKSAHRPHNSCGYHIVSPVYRFTLLEHMPRGHCGHTWYVLTSHDPILFSWGRLLIGGTGPKKGSLVSAYALFCASLLAPCCS